MSNSIPPFNMTTYAVITPRITGMISAISSFLIIYVIFKSKSKLGTIYHRILFAMSCADILGSLATALTTLPMPKRFPVGIEVDSYDEWNVTRLGNTQTCEAQGFCWVFGLITMLFYNGSLCMYYACAIAFRMSDAKIRKFVEPVLHLVPLALGLVIAVIPLFQKRYNPTGWESWCTIVTIGCSSSEPECWRGYYDGGNDSVRIASVVGIGSLIIVVVVSLLMVIFKVFMLDRRLASMSRFNPEFHGIESNNDNAKVVTIQASAYIFALVLALVFPVMDATARHTAQPPTLYANLKLFFMPLVGFFNFIIFIYHKVYILQKAAEGNTLCSDTFWEIVLDLLNGEADEPMFISRISMIQFDDQLNNLQLKVNNEYGEEMLSYSAGSQWQKDDSSKQVVNHEDEGGEGSQEEHRTSTSDDMYVGNPPTSIVDLHGSSMPSTSQGLSFQSKSTGTGTYNDGIRMNDDMSMFGLSV